jgi:hypothetical protein
VDAAKIDMSLMDDAIQALRALPEDRQAAVVRAILDLAEALEEPAVE